MKKAQRQKPKFDPTKFVKRMVTSVVAVCFCFVTTVCGIGIIHRDNQPSLANTLANISTTDLPAYTSQYIKTTQTVEEYALKNGRIYHFEVWGAKGGDSNASGGNGSYAVGWYDMRSSESIAVSVFAGGTAAAGGTITGSDAGWGATVLSEQLRGSRGGNGTNRNSNAPGGGGGGGGGASGVYVGMMPIIVAGGGGGGGGYGSQYNGGGKGGGRTGFDGVGWGGGAGTETAHGSGAYPGTDSGGGNAEPFRNDKYGGGGGGAGGGYTRGFAGGGGGCPGGGGGGSGGTSYIGGVQSLADAAGMASTTWAHPNATGNGKVVITEYIVATNVASPTSPDNDIYTVSAPSKTSVMFGESYAFTITRTIGVGDVGLQLNTTNGTLSLTLTNGNVFTYTVSNVQGAITSADFSTTFYNVAKPLDDVGCTISEIDQFATSVLKGGSYTFIVNLQNGYAMSMVSFNGNGKLGYNNVDTFGNMTVSISNVQGTISASDFTISVSRIN